VDLWAIVRKDIERTSLEAVDKPSGEQKDVLHRCCPQHATLPTSSTGSNFPC